MAERTLAENVAQVKSDFKAVKDAIAYAIPNGTPTSEYGERIFNEISNLQNQADNNYYNGFENGKAEGYENGKTEGYENGKTDGIAEGVGQGRQAQYDEFWDAFQQNGKRVNYQYCFNDIWNDICFKPKYDMVPTVATNMFYYNEIGNLEEILNSCGVVLDTSKVANFAYGFGYSTITHIPVVNLSKATNTTYLFANFGNTSTSFYRNRLVSIRKIISSETTVFANNTFGGNYCLEHCIFEGTIASNINLQWCSKLSLESLISLFQCLKQFDLTDENYMVKTLTLSAESWGLTNHEDFLYVFDGNNGEMMCNQKGWIYQ